ncbi:hypothetical protein FACS1894208_00020 [Clostridia bacterium]|nr:hypothetical protein FACS1894208_00020 [Clostridia bacterium]
MAANKKIYGRTREKQYTAWVTLPQSGTEVPGTRSAVTNKQAPYVLCTPGGAYRPISAAELAAKFSFVTDKGSEAITQNTVTARLSDGVLPWTAVKRTPANGAVEHIYAQHLPGKQNEGLGTFNVWADGGGYPDFARGWQVKGDAFVRLYDLSADKLFMGIASAKQAEGKIDKPTKELAVPKMAPVVAASLKKAGTAPTSCAVQLETELRKAADLLRGVQGVQVRVDSVSEGKDGAGAKFYRGDLAYKFTIAGSSPRAECVLQMPVSVPDKAPDRALYRILTQGESYGAPRADKQVTALVGASQALTIAMQSRALQINDAYKEWKLSQAIDAIVSAVSEKIVPVKRAPLTNDAGTAIYPVANVNLFGRVSCDVYRVPDGYQYNFRPWTDPAYDNYPAAKALVDGTGIVTSEVKPDTRTLAAAVVTGFGRLKKAAEKVAAAAEAAKKPKYDYHLVGRTPKSQAETLYVMEKLPSNTRTTMTRNQLIAVLREDRVDNAYVRTWTNNGKAELQIRKRGGGSFDEVDAAGLQRSRVNREEGARMDSERVYSYVVRALAKSSIQVGEALTLSEETPLYGSFSVLTPNERVVRAMFSVTEWKYGAAAAVSGCSLKGTVPEGERKRSILASSLAALIRLAAKGADAATIPSSSDASIVTATDDDFTGALAEETGSETAAIGTAVAVDDAFGALEGESPEDAFSELEEKGSEDAFGALSSVQQVPTIADSPALSAIATELYDTAIQAAATVITRFSNTPLTDSAAIGKAVSDMVPYSSMIVDAKEKLTAMLSSAPGDAFVQAKLDEVAARQDAVNAEFERMYAARDQAVTEEQRQADAAAIEAADAEARRQEEAAVVAADEEDPLGDLGDLEEIFRGLPGNYVANGQ